MSKISFKDKIVWIIGASSGIGESLAYEFCNEGAKVILSSRNQIELEKVKQNCNSDKESVFVLPLDITQENEIRDKTEMALSLFGRIDYLILNTGIVARDFVQNIDLSIDRKIMETNYFGAVALTKLILPAMINSNSGHIVVISSLSGKYGVPKLSAYAASKHALHGFFDSLRSEVSKQNIKITIIIPGFINTSIIKKGMDGKGNQYNKNLSVNEKGMSSQKCALKMIQAIKKEKQEVLIGGIEVWSVYLHRFFPKLFKSFICNHPIKKLRLAFPKLFK